MSRTFKDRHDLILHTAPYTGKFTAEAWDRVLHDPEYAALVGFHTDEASPSDTETQAADYVRYVLDRGQ